MSWKEAYIFTRGGLEIWYAFGACVSVSWNIYRPQLPVRPKTKVCASWFNFVQHPVGIVRTGRRSQTSAREQRNLLKPTRTRLERRQERTATTKAVDTILTTRDRAATTKAANTILTTRDEAKTWYEGRGWGNEFKNSNSKNGGKSCYIECGLLAFIYKLHESFTKEEHELNWLPVTRLESSVWLTSRMIPCRWLGVTRSGRLVPLPTARFQAEEADQWYWSQQYDSCPKVARRVIVTRGSLGKRSPETLLPGSLWMRLPDDR